MSTSPDDRLVTLLSRWLARHLDNSRLRGEIEAVGRTGLSAEQSEAVDELLVELNRAETERGRLEPIVRETIEALALG